MKCPVCNEKTIAFRQWSKAVHAFNWTCPHCGSALKANWVVATTYYAAIVSALGACLIVVIRYQDNELLMVGLVYAVTMAVAFPLAAIAWYFGRYVPTGHRIEDGRSDENDSHAEQSTRGNGD
jgi:hypothetical protein